MGMRVNGHICNNKEYVMLKDINHILIGTLCIVTLSITAVICYEIIIITHRGLLA